MNKCKRCLLKELADKEDVYAYVLKTRQLLSDNEKADDNLYDIRLNTCKQCDSLMDATCLKCGCYVEIRALKKSSRCPVKRW